MNQHARISELSRSLQEYQLNYHPPKNHHIKINMASSRVIMHRQNRNQRKYQQSSKSHDSMEMGKRPYPTKENSNIITKW